MFSRIVTMRPKSDSSAKLTKTLEEQIMPILRKQAGFRDEIILLSPDSTKAVAVSFWDEKEKAEAYGRTAYPQVLEIVKDLLEENPSVKSFDVLSSTFNKTAVKATV